jgi:hypothetical protein
VCGLWRAKLQASLRLLPILSFREYRGTVTAGKVQAALRLTAGENLRLVDLADCALLDAAAAEAIVRQVDMRRVCANICICICVFGGDMSVRICVHMCVRVCVRMCV